MAEPGTRAATAAATGGEGTPAIRWQWSTFDALPVADLYAALQLRQRVFVVEQACPFLDADGRDAAAFHLLGWLPAAPGDAPPLLAAYARIFAPGARHALPSIGRVVTAPEARRGGWGRALMRESIARVEAMAPGSAIVLEAQLYLERFYGDFGFRRTSDVYDEDGIPHVAMERPGSASAASARSGTRAG